MFTASRFEEKTASVQFLGGTAASASLDCCEYCSQVRLDVRDFHKVVGNLITLQLADDAVNLGVAIEVDQLLLMITGRDPCRRIAFVAKGEVGKEETDEWKRRRRRLTQSSSVLGKVASVLDGVTLLIDHHLVLGTEALPGFGETRDSGRLQSAIDRHERVVVV